MKPEDKILNSVPKKGDKGTGDVRKLQMALEEAGFSPGKIDDDFGTKTESALQGFQKSKGLPGTGVLPKNGGMTFEYLGLSLSEKGAAEIPPWYKEARKDLGKKETDPAYNKRMSGFWPLVGLNLKTIAKSWAAWCGLGVAVWLSLAGMPIQKDGAGAKNWAKYGQAINWKVDGIPKGAIIYIDHNARCGSGSASHVTFADGDCTAEELSKKGAVFNGLGGNQGNMVKVSSFPVAHICNVRWPNNFPLRGKIETSVGCSGKSSSGDSTR